MSLYRFLALSFILVLSGNSMASEITSNIKSLRTFPVAQPIVAARQHVIFNLDAAFESGCDWVYVAPGDTATISLLLAAKLASTPIKLSYNSTASPWHIGTCTAVEVSLP